MITNTHKKDIADLLLADYGLLGGWQRVATKVGANVATVSHNMLKPENWHQVSDTMWAKVAGKLGYKITQSEWVYVETTNSRIIKQVLSDAQNDCLFIAISEKAGSGKSSSIRAYKAQDANNSVIVFECRDWSRHVFYLKLAEAMGVHMPKFGMHHIKTDQLFDLIVKFLKTMVATKRPLLILDEADKLHANALTFLVPLYNELKGEIGVVIAGTENLEKQIKRGVRLAKKGYDEVDSRLGRSFVHLVGTTQSDVINICRANGIDRDQALTIWQELETEQRQVNGRFMEVVVDLRRLERIIKRVQKRQGAEIQLPVEEAVAA
ncbi:AAA family ATPase [Larkinella sp. VNQ87]|uniref:AAA family ATPase n=1 Tax=Larkinella sp. VNQ87 TaxID=3400921 RepID=UPI003C0B71B7